MQNLVSLGILSKNSTTHTSPVMLVARKGNERKRPVVDFRLLNTSIVRTNTSTTLLRDIFIMLVSWPENQGILFFYISKTLEMIRISFMASLLNAVL